MWPLLLTALVTPSEVLVVQRENSALVLSGFADGGLSERARFPADTRELIVDFPGQRFIGVRDRAGFEQDWDGGVRELGALQGGSIPAVLLDGGLVLQRPDGGLEGDAPPPPGRGTLLGADARGLAWFCRGPCGLVGLTFSSTQLYSVVDGGWEKRTLQPLSRAVDALALMDSGRFIVSHGAAGLATAGDLLALSGESGANEVLVLGEEFMAWPVVAGSIAVVNEGRGLCVLRPHERSKPLTQVANGAPRVPRALRGLSPVAMSADGTMTLVRSRSGLSLVRTEDLLAVQRGTASGWTGQAVTAPGPVLKPVWRWSGLR